MNQMSLFGLLLQPSLFSFITSLIIAGIVLGGSNWGYVTHSPLFYDYFFGSFGAMETLEKSTDGLSYIAKMLSKPITYNVLIIAFATLLGLVVYFVLQAASKVLIGGLSAWLQIQEAEKWAKKSVQLEVSVRIAVRVVVVVIWVVYTIFFINLLLPFCILAARVGAGDLLTLNGWGYSLLAFGLLVAGLHLHIIFARLLVLRPRLFGGNTAITAVAIEGD